MKRTPNILVKQTELIQPYGIALWVVIAHDLVKARVEMEELFGPASEEGHSDLAQSVTGKGGVGLFFRKEGLTAGTAGHECFHGTHRLLHHIGQRFDIDNHEAHAWLIDWMIDQVHAAARKGEVAIR